jgi:hypothetical protein
MNITDAYKITHFHQLLLVSNKKDDEHFVQSRAEHNKIYKGLSDNPEMQWAKSIRTDKNIRWAAQYTTPHTTISLAVEKQMSGLDGFKNLFSTHLYKASCKSQRQYCTWGEHQILKTTCNLMVHTTNEGS